MVAMPSGLETASRGELLALIGVLQDQNTHLREQVAELEADDERLTDRVAELERRLRPRTRAWTAAPPYPGRGWRNSALCPVLRPPPAERTLFQRPAGRSRRPSSRRPR